MSDFFYKEKIEPVFSPVIKVKHENISPTVVSAIDGLLSPSGNMFTRAETVKNLMSLENLSLEQTAKLLSIKKADVANKLRLLEFSEKERDALIEYEYSEQNALLFLNIDKVSRLYCIEYCKQNSKDYEYVKKYVEETSESKYRRKENVKKLVINDIGFFINSIENALRIAKSAGFEVENSKSEKDGFCDIHIRIKKHEKSGKS